MDNADAPALTDCQYGNYGATITVNGVPLVCATYITSGALCYTDSRRLLCCETCNTFYNVRFLKSFVLFLKKTSYLKIFIR